MIGKLLLIDGKTIRKLISAKPKFLIIKFFAIHFIFFAYIDVLA